MKIRNFDDWPVGVQIAFFIISLFAILNVAKFFFEHPLHVRYVGCLGSFVLGLIMVFVIAQFARKKFPILATLIVIGIPWIMVLISFPLLYQFFVMFGCITGLGILVLTVQKEY
jgi:hypothetical protein